MIVDATCFKVGHIGYKINTHGTVAIVTNISMEYTSHIAKQWFANRISQLL